jgi:predicted nucleic acid-binding protein
LTLVVDASVVVAALVDSGSDGTWAETVLVSGSLFGPHLLPVEVANILRRAELTGRISTDIASLAHADLLDLDIKLLPYELVADRVWELRANVTSYDAWYVAIAELLDSPLATLDQRLARSDGPRCTFATPPSSA